jgi:hypothetical protein
LKGNPNDTAGEYQLARVDSYLADAARIRKDKKAAMAAVNKAIEAAPRSLELNEKSADRREPAGAVLTVVGRAR